MTSPICSCGKPCEKQTGSQRFSKVTGEQQYYSSCAKCRKTRYAEARGLTLSEYRRTQLESAAAAKGMSVAEYNRKIQLGVAARQGLSESQYKDKTHVYRRHKKDYCENNDGRLGYKCKVPKRMLIINGLNVLHIDHWDGDPSNNDPSNLVTLCPTCHAIKSKQNGDHKTPGRTQLGLI